MAYEAIKTATAKYLRAQLELAAAAHVAQEAGVAVHEVRTSWLQVSAEQAVLEARVEWTREDELAEQLHDTVNTIIASLREHGV